MFGQTFYFALHKKYITVFGTLFNDMTIVRKGDSNTTQTIKVPLTYASQDKMMARVFSDPDLNRKVAAVTPAMSFDMEYPTYDASRKLQSTAKRCFTATDGSVSHQFVGVPYNLTFNLYIYSREEEDGLQILEQILPFFTPALTVNVTLIPEMNYSVDIPIILNSVSVNNESYGSALDRRKIVWTLNFTMKGEFLGPIDNNSKIIRMAIVNFDSFSNSVYETVTVTPGLTANGEPTSNSQNTIPRQDINPTDNYGYIVDITPDN